MSSKGLPLWEMMLTLQRPLLEAMALEIAKKEADTSKQ